VAPSADSRGRGLLSRSLGASRSGTSPLDWQSGPPGSRQKESQRDQANRKQGQRNEGSNGPAVTHIDRNVTTRAMDHPAARIRGDRAIYLSVPRVSGARNVELDYVRFLP
jgi:hypothetical protein